MRWVLAIFLAYLLSTVFWALVWTLWRVCAILVLAWIIKVFLIDRL